MNLRATVPPIARTYGQSLIDRTGLGIALQWHLMHSTYNEIRYLSQMTAIEHLIEAFRKQHKPATTYLEKRDFRNTVRPALERALLDALATLELDEQAKAGIAESMLANLGNINRRTLRSNLRTMLDTYGVPLDGLGTEVDQLISIRNDIVHRGMAGTPGDDLRLADHLAAAQELFRRIFLSLVGYTGTYTSYLGSIHDRGLQGPVKTGTP
ncbi:MAG: hypothetical protein NCW75_10675 [Phycisphaera sp.]|nr:MAG: hypothetical protein NCW75_10675 [Phycisphaera sp.]